MARTLGRADRLRDHGGIQQLFREGFRLERRAFVVLWRRAGGRSLAAVVAGRRLGGSVVRNRVRRRLREAYRLERQHLGPGVHICIVARAAALGGRFEDLRLELATTLAAIEARSSE
jgi:ribonuclease P protein component